MVKYIIGFILAVFIAGLIVQPTDTSTPEPVEPPVTLPSVLSGIDTQVNAVRSQNGLEPLKLDETLNTTATIKAKDMVDRNYWSHETPDGNSPFDLIKQHTSYKRAGENLAKCYNTTQEAVNAWVKSLTHYENIIGDYTHFGFGYSTREDGCVIIVNHFKK